MVQRAPSDPHELAEGRRRPLDAARSSYARKLLCDLKGFGVVSSSAPMVKDGSGRINPVARAFGVQG